MDLKTKEICNTVGLTKSIIETHAIKVSEVNFASKTVLFKPGDNCQAFLILSTGAIRVEMTAKSGRDVTLYRIKPSESCILTTSALLNNEQYYAQGVAESDVSAIAISINDFHEAIRHSSEFSRYVLTAYASRLSSIISLVDRMAARDVMFDV